MDLGQVIFDTIANPDVAYLLLILGLLSLVVAAAAPGTGFAEMAAGLCLILAFIGLTRLPVNWAGLLLVVGGFALLILDLKLQTWAVAVGGAVALAIGSVFLFQVTEQAVRVSLWLVGASTIGSLAFFGFAVNRVMRAMRQPARVNPRTIVGSIGAIRTPVTKANHMTGTAHIEGELWTVTANQPLAADTTIVVEEIDGLTLKVRPLDAGESGSDTGTSAGINSTAVTRPPIPLSEKEHNQNGRTV
ncbi:MAG: NfeD family protein [Anaerolineae bacterium]|nr:hypothetical protein [Thermoflexales bacterium]MDW8407550.1 NfeD family protein [Anaerolineae bacterium]